MLNGWLIVRTPLGEVGGEVEEECVASKGDDGSIVVELEGNKVVFDLKKGLKEVLKVSMVIGIDVAKV